MGSIYKKVKPKPKSKNNYRYTNDGLKHNVKRVKNVLVFILIKIIALAMIILPIAYFKTEALNIINLASNLSNQSFGDLFELFLKAAGVITWYSISLFILFSKRNS